MRRPDHIRKNVMHLRAEGMTFDAIAAEVGISRSAVAGIVHRARGTPEWTPAKKKERLPKFNAREARRVYVYRAPVINIEAIVRAFTPRCFPPALPVPPTRLALPPPTRMRPNYKLRLYDVCQVLPTRNDFAEIGRFSQERDAQGCANEAYKIEGAFRLIFKDGRYFGGVCWKAQDNEAWDCARQIAERARCGESVENGHVAS